ncbi:MAG: CDP-alcohol phosphatidyltransferase family protein [Bacteroidales bacterium]|nr:CDP-alcohol phosphatidyltransferase family protein [Bacteroidales bacterium]
MEKKQATRIQSSVLNALEHKALIWLAARQPKWVTSDMLTAVGTAGAFLIGLGYALTSININFLWLSTFGLFVNWYGDSLDGNLARYRRKQRPIYGYYIDHTMDVINEAMMFFGAGMAPFFDMRLTVAAFVLYLVLTLNVSMNAHLRSEFKLTYLKLGPTEFRLIIAIANTVMLCFGERILSSIVPNCFIGFVVLMLCIIYVITVISDIKYYSAIDPLPKDDNEQ